MVGSSFDLSYFDMSHFDSVLWNAFGNVHRGIGWRNRPGDIRGENRHFDVQNMVKEIQSVPGVGEQVLRVTSFSGVAPTFRNVFSLYITN